MRLTLPDRTFRRTRRLNKTLLVIDEFKSPICLPSRVLGQSFTNAIGAVLLRRKRLRDPFDRKTS